MIESNQFNEADFIRYIQDYFREPNPVKQFTTEESNDGKIPRMRLIKECAEHFKKEDPETKITENLIRVLVNSGKIKAEKAGSKTLVNLDKLIEYLNTSTLGKEEGAKASGIRRVDL